MAPRRHDAMGALAGELVGLNVDVIMAYGDEAIVAARKATASMRASDRDSRSIEELDLSKTQPRLFLMDFRHLETWRSQGD